MWQLAWAASINWRAIASSADGNRLVAVVPGNKIFTSAIAPAQSLVFTPEVNASGSPYASFTFQVEDDGAPNVSLDPTPDTMTLVINDSNVAPTLDPVADVLLAAADAGHLSGRSYLALSGGERQRVHLARVLAQLWPGGEGQILLLDEPTSMLDPLHQHTCLQAVRRLAESGAAVLVILHDLNLAARYCDRLLLLEQGRAHALGTPAEVLRAEPLQAVFGLEVLVQTHPERGHPLIVAR